MVSKTNKPVIAITGPSRGAWMPRFCVALAVRRYGGQPLQLRPGDDVTTVAPDGLVITGGHDIDPVLYAGEPEVHPNYDKERDAFEGEVIRYALQHRLPLLGICRGAQLLNICRGGSLHQELKSRRQHTSNRWTILPLKTLSVRIPSQLHQLLRCSPCKINSLHNQAIAEVGTGFEVSGRDLDGIVQAIEDPDEDFLMGVQWHPELLIFIRRQRHLFKRLVKVATLRLNARPQ
ncbi:peptidase C26 [Aliidiomarina soli]|uniref:Peptidase C26 n=2 Tax=Aliidiomarina soli TaxID=1928574 RepID=A0A432WL02_9GAMM|nr:peptidase C26 [Aliidiomarina soli]